MLFLCFLQSNPCYLFFTSYENYYSIWIKTKAAEDLQFLPFPCSLVPGYPATMSIAVVAETGATAQQHRPSIAVPVDVPVFLCVCISYNLITKKCCTV